MLPTMPPKAEIACIYTSDDGSELVQQRGEMQWVSRITKALEESLPRLYSQRVCQLLKPRRKVNIVKSFCAGG